MRKIYFIKSILCLLISILVFTNGYSQEDVRDKFTNGSVYSFKKDIRGRIWMATSNGLYVSDGNNYIQMVTGDNEITNSSIKDLVLFKDKLYLIYDKKGLIQFDVNTLVYNKISENSVASVVVQDDHNIFMLNKNGDLYNLILQKETVLKLTLIASLGNNRDNAPVMTDFTKKSLLVAVTNKGIFSLNKLSGNIEKVYNLMPDGFNNKFVVLGERIFFINKGQVHELNKDGQFVLSNYVKNLQKVSSLIPISKDQKIVITYKKNIYQISDSLVIRALTSKEKNYEIYDALYINPDYVIYGTNQGVIKVLNVVKKIFNIKDTSIQKEEYINVRRKIIPYKKNKIILLGFPTPHLYDLETKKYTPITRSNNSTFDGIVIGSTVFATSEGGGVKKIEIEAKTITNIQTKDIDTIKYYGAIANVGNILSNCIVVGRRGAIVLYNYKTNLSTEISLNNLNAKVNAIQVDSVSKLIYIATNDGIYVTDIRKKNVFKKTKIPGNSFNDLLLVYKQNGRYLWSISNLGLINIDLSNNKILSNVTLNNFKNSTLTSLLSDDQNRIWISTFKGIFSYDDVNDNLIYVREKDGLINQEFNYKSAAVLGNGSLIFGGLNGYDVIDPKAYMFSKRNLEGEILGYSVYGPNGRKYHHFNKDEIIQYNTENYYIEFYFSMKEKEKFRISDFEFRIDDKETIHIADLSFFYMYNLKDAIHKIHLFGWNDNGQYIQFPVIKVNHYTDFFNSVNFKYFLFFCVIALLLITLFIIYNNTRAVIKMKSNIAMDLHDELGTILNRSLYLIKSDTELSSNKNLTSYLSEAQYSVRTYIKAFNTEKISLHSFLNEVKDFNISYAKGLDIKFNLIYNYDKEYFINTNLYKDFKLLMYEIHHNLVKHSFAKNATTTIIAKSNKIEIVITDDGVLTNIDLIEKKGNGIANIRKRVERSNGKVVFSINPIGHGLQINGIFYI